jgi:hypothetical protein
MQELEIWSLDFCSNTWEQFQPNDILEMDYGYVSRCNDPKEILFNAVNHINNDLDKNTIVKQTITSDHATKYTLFLTGENKSDN